MQGDGECGVGERRQVPFFAGLRSPVSGFPRLSERSSRRSDELQFPGGEEHHAEQEPAVFPALDVGGAIGALLVADGDVGDLEVQLLDDRVETAVVRAAAAGP